MYCQCVRQCLEPVVDHQAPDVSSSLYYFAYPEATNCQDVVGLLSHSDKSKETSRFRGDVPPKTTRGPFAPGHDNGSHLSDEPTAGSQGYFTASTAGYSSQSHRSKIATFSSGISESYTKPTGLQRASFNGGDDEADKKLLNINGKNFEPSVQPLHQWKSHDHVDINKHDKAVKPNGKDERKALECYKKATYTVLIGNTVRVCNTKLYASLPLCNKCMVKERVKDSSGTTRVKLKLMTFDSRLVFAFSKDDTKHVLTSLYAST